MREKQGWSLPPFKTTLGVAGQDQTAPARPPRASTQRAPFPWQGSLPPATQPARTLGRATPHVAVPLHDRHPRPPCTLCQTPSDAAGEPTRAAGFHKGERGRARPILLCGRGWGGRGATPKTITAIPVPHLEIPQRMRAVICQHVLDTWARRLQA